MHKNNWKFGFTTNLQKTFIRAKVEYMSFEKIQEIIIAEDLRAKKEVSDFPNGRVRQRSMHTHKQK